jgi:hypothetical protein
MTSSIRTSNKGVITDFDKDTILEYKLTDESGSPPSASLFFFVKKHISMVPKVILQRNTTYNKVVPLVLPSCSDVKENKTMRLNEKK